MIIAMFHLKVTPKKRIHVLKTIHSMIGPTSAKSGCLHCGFYSRTQNDDELILMEKWNSLPELENHIRSEEFQKVIAAIETADELPEISFYTIESTNGMELVEKIIG